MATLAPGGHITVDVANEEIQRLESAWRGTANDGDHTVLESVLGSEQAAQLDHFDRVQLAEVIRICRQSLSLFAAGRRLFDVSRTRKASSNDADRLRKYLAHFGVTWEECRSAPER